MNAGKMRNRITFEVEGTVTNDKGFQEVSYVEYKTLWAKVNNLFGREFWSAKAINQENTVVFETRYSKDIEELDTKKTRINFKGRYFDIIHVDNVLYKNETLKIKAIEVV